MEFERRQIRTFTKLGPGLDQQIMDARQEARRAKPESIILGSVVRKQKKSAALKFLAQRLVKRGVPADERPLLMAALERELDAKIYYGDRSNLDARATASVHSKGEDAPVMTREQADEFIRLQRAILGEQMEQTELLREQAEPHGEAEAVGSSRPRRPAKRTQ
ncbi:MAG: hypothetical protein DMG30_25420 [Acidobacteria bacterium]|nr:MAG: hypothetical protein DMG30_25420 [Acidobacteriota bacterium]